MDKKKKKIIVLSVIGIITALIITGIVVFVISYKNDKKLTKEKMTKISEEYDSFKKVVENFSTARTNIYNNIFEGTYLQEMKEKENEWIEELKEYEKITQEIESSSKELKNLCKKNMLYPDKSVNNKCDAFRTLFEQSINYYVSDIETYNKNIEEYNDWCKENEEEDKKEPMEKYVSETYSTYIDFNEDGTYLGKE